MILKLMVPAMGIGLQPPFSLLGLDDRGFVTSFDRKGLMTWIEPGLTYQCGIVVLSL